MKTYARIRHDLVDQKYGMLIRKYSCQIGKNIEITQASVVIVINIMEKSPYDS